MSTRWCMVGCNLDNNLDGTPDHLNQLGLLFYGRVAGLELRGDVLDSVSPVVMIVGVLDAFDELRFDFGIDWHLVVVSLGSCLQRTAAAVPL